MPNHEANASIKQYPNVRVSHLIDTPENWRESRIHLMTGEVAFVGSGGSYYMILGDEHHTPIKDIVFDIQNGSTAHDSHIFYSGRDNKGGGGGGGGGSDFVLEPATAEKLGGVKIPELPASGLLIDEQGNLINAMNCGYDSITGRWTINKLHVDDLTFNQQSADLSTSSDVIALRLNATEYLKEDERAGLVVKALQDGVEGFLGIDTYNRIVINNWGMSETCVPIKAMAGTGFVCVTDGAPSATLVAPSSVKLQRTAEYFYEYSPIDGLVFNKNGTPEAASAIELIPNIVVNSMPVSYDGETNTYNIELDGGLTPEMAERLARVESVEERIGELEKAAVTDAVGDDHIETTIADNTLTVVHKNITVEVPAQATRKYGVKANSAEAILPTETFISDIEVDEKGHITKIVKTSLAWVIE